MKLFQVCNTSNWWWVVAPDVEQAIEHSYGNSLTREKRNLEVHFANMQFYEGETGLGELLEGNLMGTVMRLQTDSYPYAMWKFEDLSKTVRV